MYDKLSKPRQSFWITLYFVLLLTTISFQYCEFLFLYSCISYPACKPHLFRAVVYCHLWPFWLELWACVPDTNACVHDTNACVPDTNACVPDTNACVHDTNACVPDTSPPFQLARTSRDLQQCFSTAGPWHQLYRATRGSPGICHFSFLSNFHE